jgi:hypothetical protein
MINKKLATFILAAANMYFTQAIASELVVNEKIQELPTKYELGKNDTIAGAPIYTGGTNTVVANVSNGSSNGGNFTVPMVQLKLRHEVQTQVFALQAYTQALRQTGGVWSGVPCGPNHLIKRNSGAGREDACMTIDPVMVQLGPDNLLFLNVKVTNSSSRYYQTIEFLFNARMLGFRDTGTGDWTESSVNQSPAKRKLIDRLSLWGENFQKAALKAVRDSDLTAYSSVPSVRSLIDTPAILSDKDYSASFIGAANDILFNDAKQDFKALAFSHPTKGLTRFGNSWGEPTQDDANRIALGHCEEGRPSSYPPCVLLGTLSESVSPNLQNASQARPVAQEIPKVIEQDAIDPVKSFIPTVATSEMSDVSKAVTDVLNSQINSVRNSGVAKPQAVVEQTNPRANKENNSILEPKISSTSSTKSVVPRSPAALATINQSTLEADLNFNQLCTKFRSVEAFSRLALFFKKTDEEFGTEGYFIFSENFPSSLNWNPQALTAFTLNKLEITYQKSPFKSVEFEESVGKAYVKCFTELKKEKDYRYFVITGLLNKYSSVGKGFYAWMETNKSKKFANLWDAQEAFVLDERKKEKDRYEKFVKSQPITLGDDGLPLAKNSNQSTTPRPPIINSLFGNTAILISKPQDKSPRQFGDYSSKPSSDGTGFDGLSREKVDWNQSERIQISPLTRSDTERYGNENSTIGFRLSLAALAVENGEKAVSATFGEYLLSNINSLEKLTSEKRNQINRVRAEEDQKKQTAKLIADHPYRKEKISSCSSSVDQLKKTKLPSYLNSEILCTCAVDTSISELGWNSKYLDILKSASVKKEKDWTIEESRVTKLMNLTFSMGVDYCIKQQQPNN